jgi:hypothetical protein
MAMSNMRMLALLSCIATVSILIYIRYTQAEQTAADAAAAEAKATAEAKAAMLSGMETELDRQRTAGETEFFDAKGNPSMTRSTDTAAAPPAATAPPAAAATAPPADPLPLTVQTSDPISKNTVTAGINTAFVIPPAVQMTNLDTKIGEKVKDGLAVAVGTTGAVAFGIIAPMIISRLLYGPIGSKLAARSTIKLYEMAANQLIKLGVKLGRAGFTRLGMMAAEKGGEYAVKAGGNAAVVAAEAATAGAGVAARLESQEAIAAATGPAFPFVAAAFACFDALTLGLDIGDAGGYMKMGTKKMYMKIKDGIETSVMKIYAENGLDYPGIIGPLDKWTPDKLTAAVGVEIKAIMSVPGNIYIQPIIDKMLAQNITDPDAVTAFLDTETANMDVDAISTVAMDNLCLQNGGMVLGAKHKCSWNSKQGCESSYSWPMAEGSNEVYAEWKTQAGGPGQPACISSSNGVRGICTANNLPYDTDLGICTITEDYCHQKGAAWQYDDTIKDNDCHIPVGQSVLEAMFGTTIIRGIKQIFSPDMFSKCPPDAIDDGYTCRSVKCPAGTENSGIFGNYLSDHSSALIATGVITGDPVQIAVGGIAKAQLCYPPCKQNYAGGSFVCWRDCADQYGPTYKDKGALCQKFSCAADEQLQGGLCYKNCREGYDGKVTGCYQKCPATFTDDGLTSCTKPASYGRGVGRLPDKAPCPDGLRDDGTSCWADDYGRGFGRLPDKAPCPADMRDDGTSCWKDIYTPQSYVIWNKDKCVANSPTGQCERLGAIWYSTCKPGFHKVALTCIPDGGGGIKKTLFDRQTCHADEDMYGALCYPKCKNGYSAVGCCLCSPNIGVGIKKTLFDRQSCHADEEMNGALCYPKCRQGTHPVGCCVCSPDCPAKMTDFGVGCTKDIYDRGVGTVALNDKIRDSYTRGGGVLPLGTQITAKVRDVSFSSKKN